LTERLKDINYMFMKKQSAGILAYRFNKGRCEVFLIHPGGPLWKNREKDAWSIPKGEFDEGEKPFDAAKREFKEETGHDVDGDFWEMDPVIQKGGKTVYAWAVEANPDATDITSNTFQMEWPPKSGYYQHFPEADKAAWVPVDEAQEKMFRGQEPLIDQLAEALELSLGKNNN